MKNKLAGISLALTLTLLLTACPSQQTYYQIWTTAGTLADSYINIYDPGWAQKAQFDQAWATAGADIQNWQKGTVCQDVVQAISDAVNLLAELPTTTPQQKALMATILASVDVVTIFFSSCQGGTLASPQAIHDRFSPDVQAAADKLPPPKSADDVRKLWKQAGGK